MHLKEDEHFGRVVADVPVIYSRRRGLVHAQIIIFLHDEAKKTLEKSERIH